MRLLIDIDHSIDIVECFVHQLILALHARDQYHTQKCQLIELINKGNLFPWKFHSNPDHTKKVKVLNYTTQHGVPLQLQYAISHGRCESIAVQDR